MTSWHYFKILCLFYGVLFLSESFLVHVFPEIYRNLISKTIFPEKKPGWIKWAAAACVILVVFTWYKYFTLKIPCSLIVSLFTSISIVKITYINKRYTEMQKTVMEMISENNPLRFISIFGFIIGMAFIYMTFCIY
jgi:hypothetical protein